MAQALRAVLPDGPCPRPGRRALGAARRPRADARAEALHRPRRRTCPASGPTSSPSRLRDLEACGVVTKRHAAAAGGVAGLRADRLRPRAAAGHARARALGRPLPRAADGRATSSSPAGSRTPWTRSSRPSRRRAASSSGSATRSPRSSTARPRPGPIDDPDVVVEGDPEGIYHLFVDRRLDRVDGRGRPGAARARSSRRRRNRSSFDAPAA